jgi:hypothetical protein
MSHFTITVAIPGDIAPGADLYSAVSEALDPFSEHLAVAPYVTVTAAEIAEDADFQAFFAKEQAEHPGEVSLAEAARNWFGGCMVDGDLYSTYNPESQWDWWVIGGRWAGEWVLKPGADRALESEASAFGFTDESQDPRRTDAARKSQIEAESITPSFAFIDLDGEWREKGHLGWFGMVSGETDDGEWERTYTAWLLSLPADTWLVKVDAHI